MFSRSRSWSAEHQHAADVLAAIFDAVEPVLAPGITTQQIDDRVVSEVAAHRATAYFRGKSGFPAHCTTSLNEEAINTIPSSRRLEAGDLLTLQLGVRVGGWHATQGWTYAIGPVSDADARLVAAGLAALRAGVAAVRTRARTGDVSSEIQRELALAGATPSRFFTGHGIGRSAHVDPALPGFGPPGIGQKLAGGQVLSIVVLAHAGSDEVDVLDDGWNTVARDGQRSVLFSRMVRVGDAGPEPLVPERSR